MALISRAEARKNIRACNTRRVTGANGGRRRRRTEETEGTEGTEGTGQDQHGGAEARGVWGAACRLRANGLFLSLIVPLDSES